MPPNGEYSFLTGRSCPDCKYYPKEVTEAVYAHEDQHAKDEHTWSGFTKLFSKEGQRELEVNAFTAELSVTERNIALYVSAPQVWHPDIVVSPHFGQMSFAPFDGSNLCPFRHT